MRDEYDFSKGTRGKYAKRFAEGTNLVLLRHLASLGTGPTLSMGESREEVVQLIQEAMELHLRSLQEQGQNIPLPASSIEIVNVAA